MEEDKQRLVLKNLPPGYHFAPTDAELIVHYLRRKMAGLPPHLPIFHDVSPIIGYRPEQITDEFRGCGYFFTKRNRKYATGSRPDRTTPGKGFWKATGPVRPIRPGGKLVGRARTLVFHTGPDEPTHWTMYEYENLTSEAEANDKNVDKHGEWVLCTIQKSQRSDVKEEEGSGKAKGKAGGRKRKVKAQRGTDQVQMQSGELPEMQQQQQHEPPRSETTMMADDYDYDGIPYIWDEYMPPTLEYEMALPVLGVGYNRYRMTYQPATSYLQDAAPIGASGCGGGAAHYAVEQDGYPGGHLGSGLATGNIIPCTFLPRHSYAAGTTNLPLSTDDERPGRALTLRYGSGSL